MKLSEFTKSAPPASRSPESFPPSPPESEPLSKGVAPQEGQIHGQMTVDECIAAAAPAVQKNTEPSAPEASAHPSQEPQYVTSITPSGIEVAYSAAPRRHYKLRQLEGYMGARDERCGDKCACFDSAEWREVPSVTNVLGVLEKPQLVWWGMKVGVEGVLALVENDDLFYRGHKKPHCLITSEPAQATVDDVVELLTYRKLTVNHQRDKAADRGINVHDALESWVTDSVAIPEFALGNWPEHEREYISGLVNFLAAIEFAVDYKESELMVGSLQHSYAGRFDLVLTLSKPVEVVTKTYPKRKPKIEEIPAGRYLLDLKTSRRVYDTHYLQLEAYEAAAVECGYPPTDHRGIVHVTEDGRYELVLNKDWTFDDFLAVRQCYQVMNERKVVQALRDELGATEA